MNEPYGEIVLALLLLCMSRLSRTFFFRNTDLENDTKVRCATVYINFGYYIPPDGPCAVFVLNSQ